MFANQARRAEIITNPDLLQNICKRIVTTDDPDVLHQTLELLIKITDDPSGMEEVCSSTDVPFAFLLATTKNAYNRVQECALQLLTNLATCSSFYYTSKFADPLFMEEMFGILENFMWYDLHSATLKLMCQAIRRIEVADRFAETCLQRYMESFVALTVFHKLESMNVLTEMAKHSTQREVSFACFSSRTCNSTNLKNCSHFMMQSSPTFC